MELLEQGHDSLALAQVALEISGLQLTFSNGRCLKVLPGEAISYLADYGNPYDAEKIEYTFQCISVEWDALGIKTGDTFYFVVHGKKYNFRVQSTDIPDNSGWARFRADHLYEGA